MISSPKIEALRLANKLGGDQYYVRVLDLASELRCKIELRPLLVEASISKSNSSGYDWVILLDERRFGVKESELAGESWQTPLPVRLRNTVAHEIAHILRWEYYGYKGPPDDEEERAVESLSPLLLVPYPRVLKEITSDDTLCEGLSETQRHLAISREVLFSALGQWLKRFRENFAEHDLLAQNLFGLAHISRKQIRFDRRYLIDPIVGNERPIWVEANATMSFDDLGERPDGLNLGEVTTDSGNRFQFLIESRRKRKSGLLIFTSEGE